MHFLLTFRLLVWIYLYLSLINAVSTRFHTHAHTHCIHNIPATLILRIRTLFFLNYIIFSELRSLKKLPQFSLLYHYFNPSFNAFNLMLLLPMMIIEHPADKMN